MRGRVTANVRVQFVAPGHRLDLKLAHGAALVLIVRVAVEAGVAAEGARVPLQGHLLDLELAKVDLAVVGVEERPALLIEVLRHADVDLLLLLGLAVAAAAGRVTTVDSWVDCWVGSSHGSCWREDLGGLVEIGLAHLGRV